MINGSSREFTETFIPAEIKRARASIPRLFVRSTAESNATDPTPLTKRECHCDITLIPRFIIKMDYCVLTRGNYLLADVERGFILISAEN